ncbi:MAG: hypothetical protein ACP5OX_02465 [Minisyncoccia bacterium]
MFFLKSKIKFFFFCLFTFILFFGIFSKKGIIFAQEQNSFEILFEGVIKDWLEKIKLFNLFPDFYLKLTASTYQVKTESQISIPQPMKDLSTFNLAIDRYYKRPWETSGLVECEPWGVGKGVSVCLAPVFPGDLPCPLFMDCDGDGHFWWKGEDCDENCPTCYVGSKFYTNYEDGRDQDCDGLIDDNVECLPQYGSTKPFGYDSNCIFTSKTNYTLINEGETGEIPIDEIHCQKRWGQCTDYQGGFGNCEVKKTPGYFVKSSGVACGGGIFRQKGTNALFDCGKALRETSYRGYYGCGEEQCCRWHPTYTDEGLVCGPPCECDPTSPCPTCGKACYAKPHPYDACFPGHCPMNSAFEYGSGGSGGGGTSPSPTPTPPPSSPPKGVPSAIFKIFTQNPFKTESVSGASQYGPWALCHGYNEIYCQEMTGCERRFVENRYY